MDLGPGKEQDCPKDTGRYGIITQLVIYGFDEKTKKLKLISLHPGISLEEVKQNSSFEIIIPNKIGTSPEPIRRDLNILRQGIDPVGIVLGM